MTSAWFTTLHVMSARKCILSLLEAFGWDQTPARPEMVLDKIIFCVRRDIQHKYWNNVRKQNWILKSKQRTETMMKTNRIEIFLKLLEKRFDLQSPSQKNVTLFYEGLLISIIYWIKNWDGQNNSWFSYFMKFPFNDLESFHYNILQILT